MDERIETSDGRCSTFGKFGEDEGLAWGALEYISIPYVAFVEAEFYKGAMEAKEYIVVCETLKPTFHDKRASHLITPIFLTPLVKMHARHKACRPTWDYRSG